MVAVAVVGFGFASRMYSENIPPVCPSAMNHWVDGASTPAESVPILYNSFGRLRYIARSALIGADACTDIENDLVSRPGTSFV